ncbi:UNVERIFIED_CONTAM: hypothetical protein FKN15_025932 [Acipenser sinensis]
MEFPDGAVLEQSSWLPVDCRSGGIEVQAGVHPEDELPKQQVPGSLSEASRSWEMKENGPSPPAQLQSPPTPRRRRKGRGGLLPLDPVPAEQLSAGGNAEEQWRGLSLTCSRDSCIPGGNAAAWTRVREARPHSEPPSKRKKGGLLLDLEPSPEGEQLCENTGTPALLLPNREGALFTSGVPGITEEEEEEEEEETPSCTGEPKRVRFGSALHPELFDQTLPPSTPLWKGESPDSLLKSAPCRAEQYLTDGHSDSCSLPQSPERGSDSVLLPDPSVESDAGVQPATPVSEEGPPESQPPIAEQDCEILRDSPQAPRGAVARWCEFLTLPVSLRVCRSRDGERAEIREKEEAERAGAALSRQEGAPSEEEGRNGSPRSQETGGRASVLKYLTLLLSSLCVLQAVRGKGRRGRRGGKPVDRSLYVGRDYASKPPALSPITEDLHSAARTPATPTHQGALQGLAEEEAATGSQRDPENEENVPPSSPVLVTRRKPAPERGEGDPNTAAPLETTATSPEVILQAQETVHPPAARGGESSPPTRNVLDPKQGCGSKGGGAEIGKPAVRRGRRSAGVKKPLALSENGQPGTAASSSLQGEVLETAEPGEEEREGERAPSSPARGRKSVGGARRGRRSAIWQPEGHCQGPTQDSTPQEHTLAPGLSDFSIEDVLAAPHPSLAVRRSMRNRRDSGATGLGWVPKGSPSPSTVLKKRRRRRSSFGVPLRTECCLEQTGSPGEGGCNTAV